MMDEEPLPPKGVNGGAAGFSAENEAPPANVEALAVVLDEVGNKPAAVFVLEPGVPPGFPNGP
jgi:hypothetical protein